MPTRISAGNVRRIRAFIKANGQQYDVKRCADSSGLLPADNTLGIMFRSHPELKRMQDFPG